MTLLEEYDPYLANFVDDVGNLISLVFKVIQIFLGVSYYIGSKLVEGIIWIVTNYHEAKAVTSSILNDVFEFYCSIGRAVLLIYYGFWKIVESFYIVAVDIKDFCYHFTKSLENTVTSSGSFIYNSLTGLFTVVPQQIISALSMIGESSLVFKDGVISVLRDFVFQIVWSPVNVILLFLKTTVELVFIPINIVRQMPPISLLGLIVLIALVYFCRRLIRYLVLSNAQALLGGLASLLLRILSFIRLAKLRNFVTYSVTTITHFRDAKSAAAVSATNSKALCVICQDNSVSFMSVPCKHVCLCDGCVRDLVEHDSRCPICRRQVSQYDKVFIA